MLYIEYLRRDRSVPIPLYRHHARQDWAGEEDQIVANLGRTMKVGPEPHFMCWWRIRGIERMDEWEDYFRSEAGRLYLAESPVPSVLEFARSGLYDAPVLETPLAPGLHLVEFFDPGGEPPEALAARWRARAARAPNGVVAAVASRLGLLAPDPGGIAIWTFENYPAVERFLRAAEVAKDPSVVSQGLYRELGREIV